MKLLTKLKKSALIIYIFIISVVIINSTSVLSAQEEEGYFDTINRGDAVLLEVNNGDVYYKCRMINTGDPEKDYSDWTKAHIDNTFTQDCYVRTTSEATAKISLTPEIELSLFVDTEIYIKALTTDVVDINLKRGSALYSVSTGRYLKDYSINSLGTQLLFDTSEFFVKTNENNTTILVNDGYIDVRDLGNKNKTVEVGKNKAVRNNMISDPSKPIEMPADIKMIFEADRWSDADWVDNWLSAWDAWEEKAWNTYDTSLDSNDLLFEAENENLLTLEILLENGADVDITNGKGWTPLHIASYYGHLEVAQMLLDYGADPKAETNKGNSPLWIAMQEKSFIVAKLLIESGAEVNEVGDNGWSLIHLATILKARVEDEEGETLYIAELLAENGANVNPTNKVMRTPLHYASYYGFTDIARILIENGAEIEVKDHKGLTPLHSASYNRLGTSMDVVKLLIESGADVNAQDNDGWTPLDVASSTMNYDIASYLRENGGKSLR